VERVPNTNSAFLQEQLAEASCPKSNSQSHGLGKRSAKPPTDSEKFKTKQELARGWQGFDKNIKKSKKSNPKPERKLIRS
jgi:hypothetical protein